MELWAHNSFWKFVPAVIIVLTVDPHVQNCSAYYFSPYVYLSTLLLGVPFILFREVCSDVCV